MVRLGVGWLERQRVSVLPATDPGVCIPPVEGGFMNSHPYLRAYMAGIAVPTPLLLVALTLFSIARFVYDVPIPVERVIIFPMAIVPNLFGVWNMLYLASRERTHLPLGVHGAILPFILAPAGFLLGRL